MLLKKSPEIDINNPAEVEKAKLSVFFDTLKLSSLLFTAAVVLSFGAAIASFVLLLTSFSSSTLLAVFGAVFTVIYLVLGLAVNDYTKRESDFLCKVKRRPLGYLLRAKIGKRLIVISSAAFAFLFIGAVTSYVLFFAVESVGVLFVCGVLLSAAAAFTVFAFLISKSSSAYIIREIEFFEALETSFAKRTHII